MENIKLIHRYPAWYEKFSQILILIGVTMISAIVFSLIGLAVGSLVSGAGFQELTSYQISQINDAQVTGLKVFQFFSAVGLFLIPAFVVPILFREKLMRYLSLNKPPKLMPFMLVLPLLAIIYPFINWLNELNQALTLPESLSWLMEWLKSTEKENQQLIKTFVNMDSTGQYLLNVLVIAITAAVAEEFFFRGLIQRMLYQWYGRVHLAIIITAFLFSAFHMQFFGFLPRFFLGLILGYLLLYTRTIWVPVFAHFVNNFAGITAAFLRQKGIVQVNMESQAAMNYPFATALVSLVLGGVIMFFLSRINNDLFGSEGDEVQGWQKIYTTSLRHKAEIVKGALENNSIPAVILDKKDSSYHLFGEVEIYVNPEDTESAESIILSQQL